VIDLVDTSGEPHHWLSELTRLGAELYLAHAPRGMVIPMIHAVTGCVATRVLLPYVGPSERESALRFTWLSFAALYAAHGSRDARPETTAPPRDDRERLVDRAVATLEDHAIKFTDACLTEDDRCPDPVYRTAIGDLLDRMDALQRLRERQSA